MQLKDTSPPNSDREPTRRKSKERLQAQVETFGDQGVEKFSTAQADILKNSSGLSEIRDMNNLPSDLPDNLVTLLQTQKDAYVHFLRQERKMETSFIEENIRRYRQKFQPAITDLKVKLAQGNFKELPEFLGSGSNGSAFRIRVDGKTYAAKFSKNVTQENFEIKPLLRGKDIPHTAQLVSYSFEDGVVIMELLPGADVTSFRPDEAPEYSDEDIIQLIETIRELDAKGIVIDPKPSNFMYDKQQGFSILDYHLKNTESRYGLPQQIISLKNILSARKFERLDYKATDYDEKAKAQTIEKCKIFLPLMVRLLGILQKRYPAILADWQRQHSEDKADPNMRVGELIEREYIPQHPDLEPHLKKLEEMGF